MTIERLIALVHPTKMFGPMSGTAHRLIDDSRIATFGDVFIAVPGSEADGHAFILSTLRAGVRVVLAERSPSREEIALIRTFSNDDQTDHQDGDTEGKDRGAVINQILNRSGVTWMVCDDTREVLAPLAFEFAGNPQQHLTLVGVTGTNGKTTVTTLVWQVCESLGVQAALLGTVTKHIGGRTVESKLTTPGAIELAEDMRQAVEAGCSHFIMEVSSHALEQGRTQGLNFDVAVFTNLTHDHLDYHKTVEQYAAAKKTLFDGLTSDATAIINSDDPYGRFMVSDSSALVWDLTLKTDEYFIDTIDHNGLLVNMDGLYLESPLTGIFNAYNVAQAFLALVASGISASDAAMGLSKATGAPGRLERIYIDDNSNLPIVFVDYAHTPNALENVLDTLRGIRAEGQHIISVFGCGGNRDRTKRPLMAAISERLADKTVVTSDNPRFEDPDAIIKEICTGFSSTFIFETHVDRKKAIIDTIKAAPEQSLVLIAGKGHESYQDIRGVRHHLDDREIAREALSERQSANSKQGDK